MVLIWRDSGKYTNGLITNFYELADLGLVPNLCLPTPERLPNILLDITTVGEPNDFFYAGNMFIISELLKEILSEFPIKIEFNELSVTQKGKPYLGKKFYYANILEEVCCFDFEKSKYEATNKGIDRVEDLVLNEAKCKDHHLFLVGPVPKINQPNPKAIKEIFRCASEKLATKILKSAITGVSFVHPKHARAYPVENVAWKHEG